MENLFAIRGLSVCSLLVVAQLFSFFFSVENNGSLDTSRISEILIHFRKDERLDLNDHWKCRALCTAVKAQNITCVQLLLNAQASIFAKIEGRNALCHAVRKDNGPILRLLLDKGTGKNSDFHFSEALFEAAANGSLVSVQTLVEQGLDVNCLHHHQSENVSRCTPLIAACYAPYMLGTHSPKFSEVVEFLIERNARLDILDAYSGTALHWAAFNQLDETIRRMIEKQVDLNATNGLGKTPLMSCIEGCSHHGVASSDALTTLISSGAKVNLRDLDNFSALHYAVLTSAESVLCLLEAGADPDLVVDYVGLGTVTTLGMAVLEHAWVSMKHLVTWNADVNLPCFAPNRWIPFQRVCDATQFQPQHAVLLALAGSDQWLMQDHLRVLHDEQLADVTSADDREQWEWLLDYSRKPRGLRELCRLAIRKFVSRMERLPELGLPKFVVAYLQFGDLG